MGCENNMNGNEEFQTKCGIDLSTLSNQNVNPDDLKPVDDLLGNLSGSLEEIKALRESISIAKNSPNEFFGSDNYIDEFNNIRDNYNKLSNSEKVDFRSAVRKYIESFGFENKGDFTLKPNKNGFSLSVPFERKVGDKIYDVVEVYAGKQSD